MSFSNATMAATVLLSSLMALTGCAGFSQSHFTVGSTSHETYKTRHPIIIDEKEQVLDVPVASGSFDLPRATYSAIEGYANTFRRQASGTITIMVPSGSPNEAAARAVSHRIIGSIETAGVSRTRVRMARYDASQHGTSAPIRLSYRAVKASVTGCGKWDKDLVTDTSENENYHNFGCASQNNLAAQVANPADLLGPRGSTPIDSPRRNNVIDAYRARGGGL
ncbi:MAG: CpaD family pilus assembly protein [Pseudomonadota bacterium]